jgi:Exostosin family
MAKVLLTTSVPASARSMDHNSRPFNCLLDYERLLRAAKESVLHDHSLIDDPEHADLIIFVGSIDPYYRDVRKHLLFRRFRAKCFLVDSSDKIIPFLPGVYASIEKRWYSKQWTRSGHYLNVMEREAIDFRPSLAKPAYLFSFVGSVDNARVRNRIMQLRHERTFLQDTADPERSKNGIFAHQKPDLVQRYAAVMEASRFVLCPRGVGTSSWRLFETMKMGRVPVIISDQWVPPEGPAWNTFSVRFGEKDVDLIPHVLEQLEHKADDMGRTARKHWDVWFSQKVCFHRIASWCNEIKKSRWLPGAVARSLPYVQLLRPFHARNYLLTAAQIAQPLLP